MRFFTVLVCLLLFFSCKENGDNAHAGHDHDGHDHPHEEVKKDKAAEELHVHGPGCKHEHFKLEAPNGGTLMKLGGDAAVMEIVIDHKTGSMTVYFFDGLAKEKLTLEQKQLKLAIKTVNITLKADENGVFRAKSDIIKGLKKFEGTIAELEIDGLPFDGVPIYFPEGN